MKFLWFLILLICSCNANNDRTLLTIETDMGEIEIELYKEKAPKTVTAFLDHVEKGIYNNTNFYRVLRSDDLPSDYNTGLIQGGIHMSEKKIRVDSIPLETTAVSGLSHTDGTISMARTTPGSATTEFFICIGDQSPLDHGRRGTPDSLGMAAFGKVIKGMSVVRRIQQEESNGDIFKKKILIRSISKE